MSSKAHPRVQSLSVARFRRVAGLTAVAVTGMLAGAGATMPDGRPTPTGLEVPRWVSLKSTEVRARQGPGLDYRILWEYRAAGLPVQVIAETREWRKICDPQGSVAWIHRSVASGRRSVFNPQAAETPIRAARSATSPLRARLSPRALIGIDACEEGWCRIRASGVRGWIAEEGLFGVQAEAQCDAARPAGAAPR